MNIKTFTLGKEFKVGLPNYSNITSSCSITFEVGNGEKINWDEGWDEVNKQLASQCTGIEPSWIQSNEFANFFKIIVKVPKESEVKNG